MPVPEISKPFRSKLPPNSGVVSSTRFCIPAPAILMSIVLPERSKVFPAPTKFNVLTVPIPSPPD